jgi:hypothetical protein
MSALAIVAGSALAFVGYRMYSEAKTPPKVVLEKNTALKNGQHFPMNSHADNIDHVQETKGLYGLISWIVHYRDGTQSAKLYTPPTEINQHVGPPKQSRKKDMASSEAAPPAIKPTSRVATPDQFVQEQPRSKGTFLGSREPNRFLKGVVSKLN